MVEQEMEKGEKVGKGFRAANGAVMQHYGTKLVKFRGKENREKRPSAIKFQVTDVKKPLVSVSRIVEKGHEVKFGPWAEDNFIMNINTGEKMFMRRKGGGYVIDVEFLLEGRCASACSGFPRQA